MSELDYSYEVPNDVAPLHEVVQGLLGINNTQEQASNLTLEPRLEREQYSRAWEIKKRQNQHLSYKIAYKISFLKKQGWILNCFRYDPTASKT